MGPESWPTGFFGYWKCFSRYLYQVWKRILICPQKKILEDFGSIWSLPNRVVRPNQKEEVLNMEADAVQDGETY